MKLSIAVSVILIGSCMAMPQSDDEKGVRDTLKDLGKALVTNAVSSNLECHSDCLPPLYYCHQTGTFKAVCRYTGLTWFLMIGLPLIIIGAGVGIWYYRKKRFAILWIIYYFHSYLFSGPSLREADIIKILIHWK